MFHLKRRIARTALLSAAVALLLPVASSRVLAQNNLNSSLGFGLTESVNGGTKLVRLATPSRFNSFNVNLQNVGIVRGLQNGETLLGLDIRPATGQLYALGSTSRLYLINPNTAQATAVGGQFVIPLQGDFFGFDFNPTVDRIRVVSDEGQNLRINPNNGAVVDFDANPANGVQGDGDLSYGDGTDPFITAAAYLNPDNNPGTGTSLYYIDLDRNALVISPAPNAGTLSTVGSLGFRASATTSFDVTLVNGSNVAVATFVTDARREEVGFAIINLATGQSQATGRIQKADDGRLTSIALLPSQ